MKDDLKREFNEALINTKVTSEQLEVMRQKSMKRIESLRRQQTNNSKATANSAMH